MNLSGWIDGVSSDAVFGLLGVLVGALLTTSKDIWGYFAGQKRIARYLAIRVVCVLDAYVEKCAGVVLDDGLAYGQRDPNGYLSPQVPLPPAPEFPDDLDWKSIDHALAYEILSIPNEVASAEAAVAFAWDVASPPDFDEAFEERVLRYASIGLKAHSITSRLRNKYGLPAQDFGEWNPVQRLGEEKAKVDKRNADRAAAMNAMMAKGAAL